MIIVIHFLGGVSILLTYLIQKNKYNFNIKEKNETDYIIKNGATKKPVYNPHRPLSLIYSFVPILGGYKNIQDYVDNSENSKAIGMGLIAGGLNIFIIISMTYFLDQLMTPPSKKKGFWKTLYENVLDKTPEIKVPVENPVKYN